MGTPPKSSIGKGRGRESATADVRDPSSAIRSSRCRPRYTRPKTGYVWGCGRPVYQSPSSARCLGFGHSKKWCREQNDKRALWRRLQVPRPDRSCSTPKVHKLHESRLRGRRPFGT
ncbi:hypothetical protein EVAR_90445_1 [Eumeta japonica]|uniref:Uncharacterized protein n=1 Tax=Eumeta variegata TaxID=151549 RepID=A0A4C1SKF0_EUMVA|nr:hypothetical protein EVAR_90445_1 [Eumeta japonica]